MKHFVVSILACALILAGCSTVPQSPAGKVSVQITTLLGMQGSYRDFRIQVDGRFVGNYDPDGVVLTLPPGAHKIVVELPHAYERRHRADGNTELWTYTLRGEERIEVLGGGSQSLVFNADNLKSRRIEDADDH